MRVVFCGTPDFARPSLDAIVDAGHDVAMVVSQPDRRRGRRAEPTPSPVRALAMERGLDHCTLERGGRQDLYARLLGLKPDVVVVVAFGHIIREPLLRGAPHGCVNVHASLLPRWRGPAPVHRAIVAGDRETGGGTMQLEEGVDTGAVYLARRTPIGERETAGELHDRLAALGAEVLVETLDGLQSGSLAATPQPERGITHAPLLSKAEGSVDFEQPVQAVHDRIRGLNPWPGITVEWGPLRLKLFETEVLSRENPSLPAGRVRDVDQEGMVVACRDGLLRVGRVQLPGKRPIAAAEFSRAHPWRSFGDLRPMADFAPRPEELRG